MTGTGNEVLAAVAPSVLRVANDEPDLLALIADDRRGTAASRPAAEPP
jgi:hypothetical protein